MEIVFASSSTWHDRFLLPLAEGLENRGYKTKQVRGQDWTIDNVDDFVVSSYHFDFDKIKNCKKLIFLEHAVSPIKSAYLHKIVSKVDYVLVQGPAFSQWLNFCHPNVKQKLCGWHRIEQFISMQNTRDYIIDRFNFDKNKPIVLYCPTWSTPDSLSNPRCGTMSFVYPILKKLNIPNILTVPHPSGWYANNIYKDERLVVRWEDTYKFLSGCDLIMGDVSSILMEATVKDIPVLHFNMFDNLNGFVSWYADDINKCENMENLFGFLKLGKIIKPSENNLQKEIEFSIEHKDLYKDERTFWKDRCFYNLGSSLEKSLDAIEEIIKDGK
jgi:CDP-glycerol glycerophosphotransferase (TagB/SpsB family)